jgi:hypothetical protein
LHEDELLEGGKSVLVDWWHGDLLRVLSLHDGLPDFAVGYNKQRELGFGKKLTWIFKGLSDVFVVGVHFQLKRVELLPLLVGDELALVLLVGVVVGRATEEEVPLEGIDETGVSHDGGGVEEGVHELVLFEETSANVDVEGLRDIGEDVLDPCLLLFSRLRLLKSLAEKLREELKRVLIHRVNHSQVSNDEVEDGASASDHSVRFSLLGNNDGSLLSLSHSFVNGGGGDLRLLEHVDELFIGENIF